MGKNVNRLGSIIAGRMQETAKGNIPTTLELGTINSDRSLTTDSLPARISPSDYMIDIRLTARSYDTDEATHTHTGGTHGGHESGSGSHTHDGGSHKHGLPAAFRAVKPGDRVLVAWLGNEPVVVAVVVSGNSKI
jgi:hypothetical protein